MKYLQRLRQSVISNTGFRRFLSLIFGFVVLLSAVIPADGCNFWQVSAEGETAAYNLLEAGRVGQSKVRMQLMAPNRRVQNAQYTTRELYGLRGVQIIEQKTAFRYRYLSQIRLLVWYLIAGFLVLPELLYQCYGDGRRLQRELIPRSRMIVNYIKRADGKKNGLSSFIK